MNEKRHSAITFFINIHIVLFLPMHLAFVPLSYKIINVNVKCGFESILTPKSITHILFAFSSFPTVRLVFWNNFLEINRDLSALAFFLLSENHWKYFFCWSLESLHNVFHIISYCIWCVVIRIAIKISVIHYESKEIV